MKIKLTATRRENKGKIRVFLLLLVFCKIGEKATGLLTF